MSALSAISLASLSKAPSSVMVWSREWKPAIRFSRRSSVQANELLYLRASHTSTTYSAASDIFCPKPPPTSGAITRRSDSGKPSTSAMAVRVRCGICVVQVSVTRPVDASKAAWPPRASIGVAFCRCERASTLTILCAPFQAASKPSVLNWPSRMTLPGAARVHLRRAGFEGRARVDHRRGLLDVEHDLIGDVLCFARVCRHHGRDRLTDEPHHAVRQNVLRDRLVGELVQHRQNRLHGFQIGGGNHASCLSAHRSF